MIPSGPKTRAQESTNAIERLYISMRHLFNRGFYKPNGVSGRGLKSGLLLLQPEIYGSIAQPDKIELDGLRYVIDRLPRGIEACQYVHLTASEGLEKSHFKPIIPEKRRRICYRIDKDQMNVEITRGRSEVYDMLTHLTFLYIEAGKILQRAVVDETYKPSHSWKIVAQIALENKELSLEARETALIHLAKILGRTYAEASEFYRSLKGDKQAERLFHLVYWLGKKAMDERMQDRKIEVSFSPILCERIGHHLHGERWADNVKRELHKQRLLERPLHIISANMHSVMNTLYAEKALQSLVKDKKGFELYTTIGLQKDDTYRRKVQAFAAQRGLTYLEDQHSGSNIDVQIIDTASLKRNAKKSAESPVLIVMDYAFGEQAYETMDELLKPLQFRNKQHYLNVKSISIMGKAGILKGKKGDIMIPAAHIFEGTADNYPFDNALKALDFEGYGLGVTQGSMITVLGTSLQNKDILKFFRDSTWYAMGLEMEGAHYQKAIQAASKIRRNIASDVQVRYAYYASDNPLESGSTLASGGLGETGIKPIYLITEKIIGQIFQS